MRGLGIARAPEGAAGVTIISGRDSADSGMMTMGCSGLGCATSVCFASAHGFECSMCIRQGAFPAPGWWRDGALPMPSLNKPSVQVTHNSGALPWAVLVLLRQSYVDPRFPVIGTADANQAIGFALDRGHQLRPKAKIERIANGEWSVGDVPVFAGSAITYAGKWRAGA